MTEYIILSLLLAVALGGGLYLKREAIHERDRLRASRAADESTRFQAVAESAAAGQLVATRAVAVFEDANAAWRWLAASSPVLGARPLDLLGTTAGVAAVLDELHRIEVGDLARAPS